MTDRPHSGDAGTRVPGTEPGRSLDMLVAEKVMGWKRGTRYGNGNGAWVIGGQAWPTTWEQTPSFSTDITAAWKLVDHLAARKFYICVEHVHKPRSRWNAWVGGYNESATTAAHAICLAALRAAAPSTGAPG